jgi:hypothetical protein
MTYFIRNKMAKASRPNLGRILIRFLAYFFDFFDKPIECL